MRRGRSLSTSHTLKLDTDRELNVHIGPLIQFPSSTWLLQIFGLMKVLYPIPSTKPEENTCMSQTTMFETVAADLTNQPWFRT
jgi:hypothetical protein